MSQGSSQTAVLPSSVAQQRRGGISRLLLRNVAATGLTRLSAIVLDGVAYVLVARYFGPVEYGHYLAILAFLSLIDLAADMTLIDITVREMSKEPGQTGTWLGASTALRMALSTVGFLAYCVYIYAGRAGSTPELVRSAWIAALVLPAGALRMPLAVFRAQMKMHYELAVILAARLANLVLFLAIIHFHGKLYQFFLAVVVSRALLAVLSWIAALTMFPVRLAFRWNAFYHLFRESVPMGLSGLCVAVQLKVDILMVSALVGAAAAGLYGVVAQLPEYFLYIPVIISTPVLPLLSRSFAEPDGRTRFQSLYQSMFDAMMAIVMPIAVVSVVMPRQVVVLLFGDRFAQTAPVLPLVISSVVFMWFSHATAIAAVAAKLQGSFVWIQAVCVAVYLLLNVLLIPPWHAWGAASARLVATIIAPLLTYSVVKRSAGFVLATRALRRTILAACGMAVVLVLASRFPLIVAATAGILVYGAILWAIRATLRVPGSAQGEQS